jgi:hypothetical protein
VAERVSKKKPVVVLKAGRTSLGSKASQPAYRRNDEICSRTGRGLSGSVTMMNRRPFRSMS